MFDFLSLLKSTGLFDFDRMFFVFCLRCLRSIEKKKKNLTRRSLGPRLDLSSSTWSLCALLLCDQW